VKRRGRNEREREEKEEERRELVFERCTNWRIGEGELDPPRLLIMIKIFQ